MAGRCGTSKAGAMPRKIRPMKVAVPVASATGRKVRTLTSGIINSTVNITPPIGVLKVAAMPAPAPAATSVMRCQAAMVINCPAVDPSDDPIWMIGPSRPTAAPCADGKGGSKRLYSGDNRPDDPFLVIDCIHDFGHAVAPSLGGEVLDKKSDNQPAQNWDENHKDAPRARGRVDIGIVKK